MRSMKLVGLAFAAVLAMSLAVSASAFAATNNPTFFEWNGAENEVGAGGLAITAEANGNQRLVGAATVVCTGVAVEEGAKLLAGGADEETLKYTGCTVEGKTEAECNVRNDGAGSAGTIATEPLSSKLAWKTKTAANEENDESTVTVFTPKTGTKFTSLEFKGTNCGFGVGGGHEVKGEVAVNNVAPATHAFTHGLEAPGSAIKTYWLNEGGTAKEHKVKTFEVTGLLTTSATYEGKSLVTAGTEWGVT